MAVVFRYILVVSLCNVVCSLGIHIDLCKLRAKSKCQPPQNVSVEIAKGNKWVYPSTVVIERCVGGFKHYVCRPKKTVNVTVSVSNGKMCQNFTVEKHVGCKPEPAKHQCGKKRWYDEVTRKCVCFKDLCTTGSTPDASCNCVKSKKKRNSRPQRRTL